MPAMGEPRRVSASVVIVGGGPVGLGLAVTIGKAGVSCVLVERQLEPSAIPRGQNLSARSLERFPLRTTYRVLHPELKGYWWFFGRVDPAGTWFFHAPVRRNATTANLDTHALIALGGDQEPAAAFQAAATDLGVPLRVIKDTLDGQRAAYRQRFILVRPDQHVAWTGNHPPADAAAVLRRAVGAVASRS
jgi:FAD binding domain-containing protein/aromatic ring hydroxylase-like protein